MQDIKGGKIGTLVEGEDFYLIEEGFMVFTGKYHKDRGYCCENNCKHCPYGSQEKSEKKKEKRL